MDMNSHQTNNSQTHIPQALDPISLPLNQNTLIEASAGTGKTYTITTLYLRALLGLLSPDNSTEEQKHTDLQPLTPLSIEQILVVTFTEAATQEIRDRVRNKLQQVQQQILGVNQINDPVVQHILEQYAQRFNTITGKHTDIDQRSEQAKLHAYHVLQNAITLIDEASIFTIHGFCHRCLKQFAFETNTSFEQQFEMDAKPTLYIALLDFWRKEVIGLQHEEFEWFLKHWKSPDALYKDIQEVIGKSVHFAPNIVSERYRALLEQYRHLITQLKQQWKTSDFSSVLRNSDLKKGLVIYKRIPVLQDFIHSEHWLPKFDKKDSWALWGTESLSNEKNYKKNAEYISHVITAIIDKLAEVEAELAEGKFKSYWLQAAKQYIEKRAGQLKTEQQIINPDDLLTELAAAISSNHSSSVKQDNTALLKAIRHKYPIAFIDEFQDTDPVQYKIFNAIYGHSNHDSDNDTASDIEPSESSQANMILIGDPKQAIYKFRGADIFTYIQAKQDIPATQHFTLDKNWRSHPQLVQSVNHLFQQNEQGFRNSNIPFINVDAAKSAKNYLKINQQQDVNFEFWHLSPTLENVDQPAKNQKDADNKDATADKNKLGFSKSDGQVLMAEWTATNIAHTLRLANQNEAKIVSSDGQSSTIKANDICVLVRNRTQANIMKKALAALNVSSVFISRDSVFETELAKDLLRTLLAIESPINERKVRAACAGQLFCYTSDELFQLTNQAEQWQAHLDLFQQANYFWQKGQIAKSIQSIIAFSQIFSKWQFEHELDAERLITDFRHLTELLQQESVKLSGSQKLLLWFEQQVTSNDAWDEALEEQQLRLESDSQLVQITTLHASKGLEYPIVYLPMICDFKAASTALYHSNKQNTDAQAQGLTYRVDNRLLEQQIAEEERIAEDIRLLYVAMTRPVYKLVIGVYHLQDAYKRSTLAQTAIGQLLLGNELEATAASDELLQNVCQKLTFEMNQNSKSNTAQYHQMHNIKVSERYSALKQQNITVNSNTTNNPLTFTPFQGEIDKQWRMLSYSSLAAQHTSSHSLDDGLAQEQVDEQSIALEWQSGASDEIGQMPEPLTLQTEHQLFEHSPFSFPKGANAGSCLHWMLENLDFCQPVTQQTEVILSGLERFGIEDIWLNTVTDWLQQAINYPLSDFCLADITEHKKLVEMEFYFSFERLNNDTLSNALLMLGVSESQVNKDFQQGGQHISGILKGFIDLTLEYDNKYYVLDYKSNFLGNHRSDYSQQYLQICMSDHSYYLQGLIYCFALHRFLKQKLTDYDYERDVGGAFYLFLRGMCADINRSQGEHVTGVYHMQVKYDVIQYLENSLNGQITVDKKLVEMKAANVKSDSQPNTVKSNNSEQLGFGFE